MDVSSKISGLLLRKLDGTITDEENILLIEWSNQSAANARLLQNITNEETLSHNLEIFHPDNWQMANDRMRIKVLEPGALDNKYKVAHRVHFLKTSWVRYAAAIIILFGIGAYFYTAQQKNDRTSSAETLVKQNKSDIYPGTNKAMLTLADGSVITLDSAANGQLAIQEGAEIIKLSDGQLSYKITGAGAGAIVSYNTMSTPRGGQYQLTLPDGTNVWLNASSSIMYPTVFTGETRKVKVTGEAYFEVSKNKEKPFIVNVDNKASVRVLGTHFNINSYDDEPNIRTTLLEGSIEIQKGTKVNLLAPGEQAIVDENIRIISGVNVQRAVAWKNGYFNFEGASIEEFMRQLARWYDLQIVYKGKPDGQIFKGELGRDLVLSEVLETLKFFNIKYSIEGRILTIE